jgi:hypothetical protein
VDLNRLGLVVQNEVAAPGEIPERPRACKDHSNAAFDAVMAPFRTGLKRFVRIKSEAALLTFGSPSCNTDLFATCDISERCCWRVPNRLSSEPSSEPHARVFGYAATANPSTISCGSYVLAPEGLPSPWRSTVPLNCHNRGRVPAERKRGIRVLQYDPDGKPL